jgi:hypothetical protein
MLRSYHYTLYDTSRRAERKKIIDLTPLSDEEEVVFDPANVTPRLILLGAWGMALGVPPIPGIPGFAAPDFLGKCGV